MAMTEKVRVRRSQIMAAQLWVETDLEDGRATPQWIKDLAALGHCDPAEAGDTSAAAAG